MDAPTTRSTSSAVNTGEARVEKLFYIAYFRLHDIPWEIPEPITIQDAEKVTQVKLGSGPFRVPAMAMQQMKTRAGGATLEFADEISELNDGLYCEVAFDVSSDPHDCAPDWAEWWDNRTSLAEQFAASVSLCLSQRIAPVKVGEYVRLIKPDTSYGKSFRFQGYAGAEAAVTTAAQEDIRRAVEAVANQHLAPQVYVALNWYDQSKRAETGADRLVALWIALEALMSIERSRGKLDTKAARFLSSEAFSLGIKTDRIHEALGLGEMRRLRNRIVHLAYPVAYSGYNIWCR